MPIYEYQAFDGRGKKTRGVLEASSEKEAKEKLRGQGLLIAALAIQAGRSRRQRLKGDNLLVFTMQLSQLLNAGVPLYESLIALEEQYRGESFHRIVLSLCDQIKRGSSLSEAMGTFPDSFDKLYRAMVSAGEAVGSLDQVLNRLVGLISKQLKIQKQVFTAMVYPAILASFSLLIIMLLLGFVVPSIEAIFADRPLSGFTRIVLGASHLFRDYWWIYLPTTAALAVFVVIRSRTAVGRVWWQRNLLKVPLVKTLLIQTAFARFSRTMNTLLEGGVTMIESMGIARQVMKNVVLEEEILLAEAKIVEGSSISGELARSSFVPSFVSRMVAVGEETGTTATMFEKIADMYEDSLEKTIARLMALIQPIILVVMGVIIGFVLLAILLPLTDVMSLGAG